MMMTKDLEMMTTCLHLRKWKGLLMRPPRWRRLIRSRVARYEFALGCGHFVIMNSVGVHHCVCNMGCPKKPIHTFRPVQGQKSWDGHVGIFCISSAIQYYISLSRSVKICYVVKEETLIIRLDSTPRSVVQALAQGESSPG